jgi:putative salt-induced outer membrane protein
MKTSTPLHALPALALLSSIAHAQVTLKPDGQFRSLWGAAASVSGGNTRATTVTLTGETALQTDHSKWTTAGRAFYAKGEEGTTAANLALGTQYDQDLFDRDYFGVTKFDYLRDRPSNINARVSAYGGFGRHLIRNDQNTWDVLAGLGYTQDRYVAPADINGDMRTSYGHGEGLVSETSNHKLTSATTLRQKLEWYPNLSQRGESRAVLDMGLSVAMTAQMQLTTGLLHRYSSNPGVGLKKYDTLFLTGVSFRFD